MKMLMKKRIAKGFSLIEAIMVLGLSGVALTATLLSSGSVQDSSKAGNIIGGLNAIKSSVREIYTNVPTYNGINVANLINTGEMPGNYTEGTVMVHDFGQGILVASTAFSGIPDMAFTVTLVNIPDEVCADLVVKTAMAAKIVTVGGSVVKALNDVTLNTSNIVAQCTGAPKDIAYTYL